MLLGILGTLSITLALISRYTHALPESGSSLSGTLQAQSPLAISQKPWSVPLQEPLVIAHRGASSALPELAKEAYQLAIEQGPSASLVCKEAPTRLG